MGASEGASDQKVRMEIAGTCGRHTRLVRPHRPPSSQLTR